MSDNNDVSKILRDMKDKIRELSANGEYSALYELNCEILNDEKFKVYMWEREKAERDYASAIRQAEKRGFEKGFTESFEKGYNKSKNEVIEKLIASGIPESEIKKYSVIESNIYQKLSISGNRRSALFYPL